jgi:hypothetical protein
MQRNPGRPLCHSGARLFLGASPESITTNVDVARSWGRCAVDNRHRWLWVPAFAGMTGEGESARRANQRKRVQPGLQKYIASPLAQINSISPAVSRSPRGADHDRHERWRGMRWTRVVSNDDDTNADGKAVWSWRPDAGVKWCGAIRAATVANKPGHRGERGISRNTIVQGMPDCCGEPVVTMLVCFIIIRTRDCGCTKHPAFPAPSDFSRDA